MQAFVHPEARAEVRVHEPYAGLRVQADAGILDSATAAAEREAEEAPFPDRNGPGKEHHRQHPVPDGAEEDSGADIVTSPELGLHGLVLHGLLPDWQSPAHRFQKRAGRGAAPVLWTVQPDNLAAGHVASEPDKHVQFRASDGQHRPGHVHAAAGRTKTN